MLTALSNSMKLRAMPCSVQFSLWVMSDCLRPHGLQHARVSVHHHLLELAQTHVHQGGDAIQPSHSLLSPSPPAINLSQQKGLFQWVGPLHQVAKVFEIQHQHSISMNIQEWFPLGLTGWISLQPKGLSIVFCNTTFQKYQFFGPQLSLWSNVHTWLLEKP